MKIPWSFRVLMLLNAAWTYAQGNVARFIPAEPHVGDTLRMEYNAGAEDAALKEAVTMVAEIVHVRRTVEWPITKIQLSRKGNTWSGVLGSIVDGEIAFLARFRTGDAVDLNRQRGWSCVVVDSGNRPFPRAHEYLALYHSGYGIDGFEIGHDEESRIRHLEQERATHPGNVVARILSWSYRAGTDKGDAAHAEVQREADSLYGCCVAGGKPEQVLIEWFERHGEYGRADTLRRMLAQRFPEDVRARDSMRILDDPFAAALQQHARNSDRIHITIETPTRSCGSSCEEFLDIFGIDSTASFLLSSGANEPHSYFLVAALLLQEEKPQRALDVAQAGVDALRLSAPAAWLADIADRERWHVSWASPDLLYVYLLALVAVHRSDDAVQYARMLVDSTRANSQLLNDELCRLYDDAQRYDDLERHVRHCLEVDRASDDMLRRWRAMIEKRGGKASQVDDTIAAALRRQRPERLMRLRGALAREIAPELEVSTGHGSRVPLSSLKGRVVVLLFWSSWCGAVERQFPALNMACERYRDDPRVAFFAINTLSEEEGPALDSLLLDARSRLTCPIPCYRDSAAGKAFTLNSLPHVFILAPDGFVRFSKDTYHHVAQYTEELIERIGICLEIPSGE
jgi:cytochrome c biogenesis protein CcmG, thiol:disulfide interchange protein DsbE